MLEKNQFEQASLGKCMSHLYHHGIQCTYKQYMEYLLTITDWDEIIKDIFNQSKIEKTKEQEIKPLLMLLLEKLAASIPICAKDEVFVRKEINELSHQEIINDPKIAASIFLRRYELLNQLLKYAQFMKIEQLSLINERFDCDLTLLLQQYQKEAYLLLEHWQYYDVTFHERFLYRFLAQFHELYDLYQEDAQCDVADLYLLHGYEKKAHDAYRQLLKQTKDYGKIAIRYASIVQKYEAQKVNQLIFSLLDKKDLTKDVALQLQQLLF